jgi:ABC-type proline/glycine betaine transport systems, ATPase components
VAEGSPRIPADATLHDALALLIAEKAEYLLVVGDDGAPLGAVSREDLLR